MRYWTIYSIDELSNFASVILYIIGIPVTHKNYYKKATKYKFLIDTIEYNYILQSNDDVFAIKKIVRNIMMYLSVVMTN